MKIKLILISLFFALQADVLYVDNQSTGSEEGTLVSPYQTLTTALSVAKEGDTIYLREGIYEEEPFEVRTNDLHIASYPGEWAVLRGPIDDSEYGYVLRYAIPITKGALNRVELEGGYYYCLKFESDWGWDYSAPFETRKGASGLEITNSKFHGSGRDCIKITPACNDLVFQNCEFYNSGARDDSNAEGIDNVNGANMVVEGCYFHDIATNGVYAKGGAKNALIRNNVIENCGVGGIMLGFYTDMEWFNSDENPDYQEALNPEVYNNYIFHTGGAGIGLYGAQDARIYNNTLINTAKVYHGSLFMEHGEVWISSSETVRPINKGVQVFNNIVYNDVTVEYEIRVRDSAADSTCRFNYNCFYNGERAVALQFDGLQKWPAFTFDEYQAQTPHGTNAIMVDPGFDENWHIMAGSSVIDAAFTDTFAMVDYDGHEREVWDIGADEFATGEAKKLPPLWSDGQVAIIEQQSSKKLSQMISWKEMQVLVKEASLVPSIYSISGKSLASLNGAEEQFAQGVYLVRCLYENTLYTYKLKGAAVVELLSKR